MIDLAHRSQIAAKRRNNRTRRELPLLAAQDAIPADMLTTPEAQAVRLEHIADFLVGYRTGLDAFDAECEVKATAMREFCRTHLDDAGFAALEARSRYTLHLGAVYRLDFWHHEAARLEPSLCPHAKNNHEVCRALDHEHCPICGCVVALEAKEEPKMQQLTLLRGLRD